MANKKSRKVGKIGVSKTDSPKPTKVTRAPKAKKGHKSGSRQQTQKTADEGSSSKKLDPKVGSKKPIDLSRYKQGAVAKTDKKTLKKLKYASPQEELDAIENDPKLEKLLELQDERDLTKSEQAYVNKTTKRYQDLCELLGIEVEADENQIEDQDDPFAQLDAIKLDDYKD